MIMNEHTTHVTPTITVTIPCRNEEGNAAAIAAAVIAELEPTGETFDIIFIDNASDDRTVPIIRELCARDPRIRLIINARNFGQMRSPTHAIFQARGRAVIAMCADFQDPPALLGQFVERWRKGADIILGVRGSEASSLRLRLGRALAYWFAKTFGDYPIIPNATGFGLYDRKVVDTIARLREPEPFFRGMLVETGYSLELIHYERPQRKAGRSNNNFFALLDFALSGLAGASKKIVRVPFYIGVLSGLVACLTLCGALIASLLGARAMPWLAVTLIETNFAVLFTFLGIVGDQIRLISERTRQTPLVIERERVNFPPDY
jgi:polyisoprenyl-phosphate glycosyltransferase